MKKNLKIKLDVLIFYISYTLILFSTMFRQVKGIDNILSFLNLIGMVMLLFICIINLNKITIKEALILFIVILLSIGTRIVTGTNTILVMCLLIIAGKNIELNKLIKYDLKIKIPFLLIVSSLYFLDLTNVNLHYRNGVVRHSMGFSNPNTFSTFVMSIIIEYLYLRKDKLNIMDFILVVCSIFIINYYADSRTQITCLIILSLIMFLNKYTKQKFFNNRIVNLFTTNIFIILTILSLVMVNLYKNGNSLLVEINLNMSDRLKIISTLLEQYDINMFGNKVKLVTSMQAQLTGEKQIALDNVYIYSLLSYGLLPYAILCIFMRKYMKYTIQENQDLLRLIMLVFLIGGIMERFCLEVHFNIFLLYFSHILYHNKKNLNSKENDKNSLGEIKWKELKMQ